MKVYVATAGEYSDFQVVGVFTRQEDAWAYELGDGVEEYELHDGPVEVRSWHHLVWSPNVPDRDRGGDYAEMANPHAWSELREFDGHPNRAEHRWDSRWYRDAEYPILLVEGWDLERVRKVYSEQRAQHLARIDMGIEPERRSA